jgi:hypothetical protein
VSRDASVSIFYQVTIMEFPVDKPSLVSRLASELSLGIRTNPPGGAETNLTGMSAVYSATERGARSDFIQELNEFSVRWENSRTLLESRMKETLPRQEKELLQAQEQVQSAQRKLELYANAAETLNSMLRRLQQVGGA